MKTPMQELIDDLKQMQEDMDYPPELNMAIEIAAAMLEKEKEVAQQYAEFAIECDRKELPVLEFDGWINL